MWVEGGVVVRTDDDCVDHFDYEHLWYCKCRQLTGLEFSRKIPEIRRLEVEVKVGG